MKRGLSIVLLGLIIGVSAFIGYYQFQAGEQKKLAQGRVAELGWLKEEFQLSDAEWKRVTQLHEGYLPRCAEMCEQIASKNAELKSLLGRADAVTPEIERKLREINDLRSECQGNMLRHFFEVSRAMQPEQGRRYLQWVQDRTIFHDSGGMPEGHQAHE